MERNLQDALGVARNIVIEPKLVLGGGAVEMALSQILQEKSKSVSGVKQWPYSALAQALEVNTVEEELIFFSINKFLGDVCFIFL